MENTRGFLKAPKTGVISILCYKNDTILYLLKYYRLNFVSKYIES